MKMYSTGEAARQLGIQPYRLTYLISTGQVSDAALRIAGKRAWSDVEVAAIREYLEQHRGENDG